MLIFSKDFRLDSSWSKGIDWRIVQEVKDGVVVHFNEGDKHSISLIIVDSSYFCGISNAVALIVWSFTSWCSISKCKFIPES